MIYQNTYCSNNYKYRYENEKIKHFKKLRYLLHGTALSPDLTKVATISSLFREEFNFDPISNFMTRSVIILIILIVV